MSVSRLRELFEQALERPAAARGAWLDVHCHDAALRARLERMLDAEADTASSTIGPSARALSDAIGEKVNGRRFVGARIDEWTLDGFLGEGGSATVYRAWRDIEGVRQRVALKLLQRGLHSPEAHHQFRRERQALATLTHPNIALLIDGGVTDEGVPYLVIEYVDGLPITEHACAAQLDLRARLRLMVVACRAVAAAQRLLIVHRDLKPANIFVRADGTVKLLDFGIAKLLDAQPGDGLAVTRTGYAPLTPAYAAPEQFDGGTISTATDVYALGVVLHELLLGERPDRAHPVRPSARVGVMSTDLWRLPAPRPVLRAALRGDLDNILLRALAEEPERRYAGASELADDLERHLDALPVHAHPPSRWYRTRKFVQRHRGGVAITLVLSVAVLASLVVAVLQTMLARREAARASAQTIAAQHEAQRANAVRDFVESLFTPIREGVAEGKLPSVTELVERGVERIGADTALAPAERIDLLMMFARLNDSLGVPRRGRELGLQADRLARYKLPPEHPLAIGALALRGIQAVRADDHAAAEAPLNEALARVRGSGRDDASLTSILDNLSMLAMDRGDAEKSLALAREALDVRVRRHGAQGSETAAGYNNVGYALVGLARYAEAAPFYEQAWRIDMHHLAPDNKHVLTDLSNWGWALAIAGEVRAGRVKLREADAGFRQLGGNARRIDVYNSQKLCALDAAFGIPAEAAASCTRMLAITRAHVPDGGLLLGYSLRLEALRLLETGNLDGASALLDTAWAEHPDSAEHARGRGGILTTRAQIAWLRGDARAAVAHGLAAQELIAGVADSGMSLLALRATLVLACAKAPADGCKEAVQAVGVALDERADGTDPRLLPLRVLFARSLLDEQPTLAIKRIDDAIARSANELDANHPMVVTARAWRAHAQALHGDCARARGELDALRSDEATSGPHNPWLREALAHALACEGR